MKIQVQIRADKGNQLVGQLTSFYLNLEELAMDEKLG